jgi:glycosyltransferase 2 family protein
MHDAPTCAVALPDVVYGVWSGVVRDIWSKVGVGLALGLLVIVGLALVADLRAVVRSINAFHWPYLPAIVGLTVFNHGLRWLKWHYYIRLIGASSVTWQDSLRLFLSGLPLALSPGKLAEPVKAVWLKQISQVPVARGIPVIAAERISDGLAFLLLSTLGVIAYPQYWPAFVAILTVLSAIIVISQVRPLALGLIGLASHMPVVSRFTHHLTDFYESANQLFSVKSSVVAVSLGVVAWLGQGLGFYLVLRGLGVAPSPALASIAIFALSFSTIVGAVSSLPGGLGAAEGSLAGLLAVALGLSGEIAAAATLIIRFFTLWLGVVVGMGTLLGSRRLLGMAVPSERSVAEMERVPRKTEVS